jgi:hypothetical protein
VEHHLSALSRNLTRRGPVWSSVGDARSDKLTGLAIPRLDKSSGVAGYQVLQHEVDETNKTLKLWVRRKRGTKKLICSGCGKHCGTIHDTTAREVRDLPWGEYRTTPSWQPVMNPPVSRR